LPKNESSNPLFTEVVVHDTHKKALTSDVYIKLSFKSQSVIQINK
jgi:hypothetical protein